jgi:hypothetical protein
MFTVNKKEIVSNFRKNKYEKDSFRSRQRQYVGQYRLFTNRYNKQDYNTIHNVNPPLTHLNYGLHIPQKIPIHFSGNAIYRNWSRTGRANEFDKYICESMCKNKNRNNELYNSKKSNNVFYKND